MMHRFSGDVYGHDPRRSRAARIVLLCVLVVGTQWCNAAEGAADTATGRRAELLAGKAAARDGDHRTALARYAEAQRAGDHSELLQFNKGVSYYRLGQHALAEAAFLQASAEPKLLPVSYYNLGLVSRALGDAREARVWFEQVERHSGTSAHLRVLAKKAIQALPKKALRERLSTSAYRRTEDDSPRDLLVLAATSQLAHDSNLYRGPSKTYVDLAQAGTPTVEPEVQAGMFTPLDLLVGAHWGDSAAGFSALYSFGGRFYLDSEFSNANEQTHEALFRGWATRDLRWGALVARAQFRAGYYRAEAFDHDDGSTEFAGNEDVSGRLTYSQLGPAFELRHDLGIVDYGLRASAYLRSYDETTSLLDYGHERVQVGAFATYRPFEPTSIETGYDLSRRSYFDRPARNASGQRLAANSRLDYRYARTMLTLRQQLGSDVSVRADCAFTTRNDEFVGYDDYERSTVGVALEYRAARRLMLYTSFLLDDYTFPNGFAFDTPIGGDKTLTVTSFVATADYLFSEHFSLRSELRMDLDESTDKRIEFERTQAALGVRWNL